MHVSTPEATVFEAVAGIPRRTGMLVYAAAGGPKVFGTNRPLGQLGFVREQIEGVDRKIDRMNGGEPASESPFYLTKSNYGLILRVPGGGINMSGTALLPAKVDPKTASGPALRTFFKIAEVWDLDEEDQMKLLGLQARSTFYKWKKDRDGRLSMDALERISYILGIFKALNILLPDKDAADKWIKKPNEAPIFGGKSALERMLSGHVSDLFVVRQYLDAQRGGWA